MCVHMHIYLAFLDHVGVILNTNKPRPSVAFRICHTLCLQYHLGVLHDPQLLS